MPIIQFALDSLRYIARGNRTYYIWLGFLTFCMLVGGGAYLHQLQDGLITTNMRDPVSWGFYIGNFTFLVGVAAASVMLVIPAYIYNWKPIKEIAILGELLAVAAMFMCLGFVMVDIGRPDRFWHIVPLIGTLNFPASMLAWDVLVLNGYMGLNLVIVTYLIYCGYRGIPYNKPLAYGLLWLSIPVAFSIHTVTAFLYAGVAARPFWSASILAPRFIASALCSGPAILLILFQILRKTTNLEIKDEAIRKVAELMAYSMGVNLFLLGAEVFKEFYSHTHHGVHAEFMFFGLHGHNNVVFWTWLAVISSTIAFVLFLVPKTRNNWITLNIGCVLIFIGVYVEKGMGLIIPGLTPGVLGEMYDYSPSGTEWLVALGVYSAGTFAFTLMVKVAMAVLYRHKDVTDDAHDDKGAVETTPSSVPVAAAKAGS